MRILFVFLIILHGVIHFIGFSQAFGVAEFKLLHQPVTKILGIVWLLAGFLFILVGVLYFLKSEFWWTAGFIAIVVSQMLIVMFWQDAKFGTIANLIILAAGIIICSNFRFHKKVDSEVSQLFLKMKTNKDETKASIKINELPIPVSKWLKECGGMENKIIENVYLRQEALMKMNPGQKSWYKAKAEQYFTIQPPAFNWFVDLEINPLITVVGRDRFEGGKGEMLIKVLSIFPVVNVKENEKVNQAALQRYLAEIVWFPSAAMSPNILWESINDYSAKATITCNGTTGSGVFYFDENGCFEKFGAMRYKDVEIKSELNEWTVEAVESKVLNGVRIPVELKATWKLDHGDWTWLKLKLTEIHYNVEN